MKADAQKAAEEAQRKIAELEKSSGEVKADLEAAQASLKKVEEEKQTLSQKVGTFFKSKYPQPQLRCHQNMDYHPLLN